MRVAVLVLAHNAPRALFATAAYFAPADVDIFVHVDAKTDFAGYVAGAGPWPARLKFLAARRRVYWGGFSMVEATLDLLRAAFEAGPYDRYLFISDNSLPVQSLDGFFATLAAREDMIECRTGLTPKVQGWYDGFYLMDDDLFDFRRGGVEPKPVDAAMQGQLERLLALKARGKKPGPYFRGQPSWALGPDSVALVLDAADNDAWWVESCRYAVFSDEMFFNTIVGAAKYPGGLLDPPTYADKFRAAPRLIRTARDLPFDMQPHFLFLRQIAPDFAEDLPQTCLRLYGGVRHMLANDPAVRAERVIAVSDGGVPHLHVFAPVEDASGWGESLNRNGRRFRNPLADAVVWRLRAPASWRQLRLSLPCFGRSGDAILPRAAFEIAGERVALKASDAGYSAEFSAIERPFDTITLRLPPERPELALAVLPQA